MGDVEMRLELAGLLSKAIQLLAGERGHLQNARDSLVSTPLNSEEGVAILSSRSMILSLVPSVARIGKEATHTVDCPRHGLGMSASAKTTRIKIAWSVQMNETGSQHAFATVLGRLFVRLLRQSLHLPKEGTGSPSSNFAGQLYMTLISCLGTCASDLPLANLAQDLACLWLDWFALTKSDKMERLTDQLFVHQLVVILLVVEGLLADREAGLGCTNGSSATKRLCGLVCRGLAEGSAQNIEIVSVVFTSVCAVLLSQGT